MTPAIVILAVAIAAGAIGADRLARPAEPAQPNKEVYELQERCGQSTQQEFIPATAAGRSEGQTGCATPPRQRR